MLRARARLCVVCVSKARVLSLVHTAFLPKTFSFFFFFLFFEKEEKISKFFFFLRKKWEKRRKEIQNFSLFSLKVRVVLRFAFAFQHASLLDDDDAQNTRERERKRESRCASSHLL